MYPLAINSEIILSICPLESGVSLKSNIFSCSKFKKREELFAILMRANFLGQGTGKARIGLDPEEKSLTLSLGFPYEINQDIFKEIIEDFVNYHVYWREEIEKLEEK